MAANLSSMPDEFPRIADEIDRHEGLNGVLAWAAGRPKDQLHPQNFAEVVTQYEFTHDVIVPYKNIFLVYDTT